MDMVRTVQASSKARSTLYALANLHSVRVLEETGIGSVNCAVRALD